MSDTLFADVSSYQSDVDSQYPYSFFSFRSNDGTYKDSHFANNLTWAKHAVDAGKLKGFLVYFVYETNWEETFETFKAQVGQPSPNMAVMIDVESWGGKITGSHASAINALRHKVVVWLNQSRQSKFRVLYRSRDNRRVIGYGNQYDLANIWPGSRGDANLVVAAYGSTPSVSHMIAHQFSQHYPCKPFGYCDMNSADNTTAVEFVKKLGLDKVKPVAAPKPPAYPLASNQHFGVDAVNGKGGHKDRVAEITQLQRRLVHLGYTGKVDADAWCDGIYGVETANAVKVFKKKQKGWLVTGNIGSRAWNKLFNI